MKTLTRLFLLLIFFSLNVIELVAQGPDCIEALVICTDGAQSFTPQGAGINDFANPANDNDCLLSNENQSAWYYFEFQPDMPPGSMIGFTLTPDGGFGEDYDFAVYGPDVDCDNLGQPLRCSYADQFCAFCPDTGLGNGTTDFSEPASGDGFVAPISVNPGEGFYLIIDNWLGSSTGFNFEWTGSAAPYLNCNVGCDLEVMAAPPLFACSGGDPVTLFPIVTGNSGDETYFWSSPSGIGIIDDPFSPNPTISFPDNTTPGSYEFTLTVTDGECEQTVTFVINVSVAMVPPIIGNPFFCENGATVLSVLDIYADVIWSDGTVGTTTVITSPGQYSVTVTDLNGCTATNSIDVIQQPSPDPFISGISQICSGDIVTLTVEDMDAINFIWSNNQTSQNIVVNTPGIYSVTTTNSFGCEGVAFFEITPLPEPFAIIDGNTILCAGDSTILSTDFGLSSYLWSTGETTEQITVLEAGTVSLTVTNAEGCQAETAVEIIVNGLPDAEINGDLAFCEGFNTILEGSFGNSVTYEWSTGSTDPVIEVQTGGTYILTVTDENGCSNIDSVLVTENSNPEPSISGNLNICDDESAVLNAGDNYDSYIWSTGDSIPEIIVDTEDLFEVTVTDINGCIGTASHFVTINTSPTPEITGEDIFCLGDTTILDAGNGFTIYEWSNGDSTQLVSINIPGNYDLTVTDENGCQGIATMSISELPTPVPDILGSSSFCDGEATQLQVDSFPTYAWSNGDSTQMTSVDTPGELSIIVTDSVGCQGVDTIQIEELPLPPVTIVGDLDICENESSILSQDPFDDTHNYQWNNGSNNSSIEVDEPGAYSLTIIDENGCVNADSVELIQFMLPEPEISGNSSYCFGESTDLSGNDGFNDYQWSNGSTNQSTNISSPGLYTLQVTDANGCQGTSSIEITELELPESQIVGETDFCSGESTTLSVNTFDTYAWSNGNSTQTTNINTPGELSIIVTDDNGCQGVDTIQIVENPLPPVSITGDLDICENESSILSQEPFDDTHNYQWNNGSNNSSIEIDEAGAYSLTITDENGCVNVGAVELIQFMLPEPEISGNNSYCFGESTDLNGNDGFNTYQWSNGSTDQSTNISSPGLYSLLVTDANGCQGTTSIEITELELPEPEIVGETDFCFGESTTLSVNSFDSYAWSNGNSTPITNINTPGEISIIVTDINGCQGFDTIQIIENPLPIFSISGDLDFCSGESSILSVETGFENYQWSNGLSNSSVEVTEESVFSITVTDANGCSNTDFVNTTVFPLPMPTIIGDLEFCEGESTSLQISDNYETYIWNGNISTASIVANNSGTYTASVIDENACIGTDSVFVEELATPIPTIGGITSICSGASAELDVEETYPYYTWSTGSNEPSITASLPGIYSVSIIDVSGCPGSASIDVQVNDLPIVSISGLAEICDGDQTTLDAGDGFASYLWSDNSVTQTLDVSNENTYSVTVTDENGCQNEAAFSLAVNALPTPFISGVLSFCSDTTSILTATAGFQSYVWNTGNINPSLQVNATGLYSLTVTDQFGCEGESMVNVEVFDLPVPSIIGDLEFCVGESTTLSVSNTYENYQWSNGANTPSIVADASNSYSLIVTDENGCTGQTFESVIAHPIPQFEIQGETSFCTGQSVSLSIPDDFEEYLWSNGGIGSGITISDEGQYSVEVTDINGCSNNTEIVIVEHPLPVFNIDAPSFFCENEVVSLVVEEGFSEYLWSEGSTNPSIEINEGGAFGVTITNEFGCIDSSLTMVAEIPLPIANAGNDGEITCTNPSIQLDGSNSTGFGEIQFVWEGPDINEENMNQESPEISIPGIYNLSILDTEYQCLSNQAEVIVSDNTELPNVSIQIPDTLNCANESVIVDGSNSDSGINFQYQWYQNGDILDEENNNNLIALEPSIYTLFVTNTQNGCVSSESIEVFENRVFPIADAGIDMHIDCYSPTASLIGNNSEMGSHIQYSWSTLDGNIVSGESTTTPLINQSGQYIITVFNTLNMCSSEDAVLVTQDFELPIADAGAPQELDCLNPSVILDGSNSSSGNNFVASWMMLPDSTFLSSQEIIEVSNEGSFVLTILNLENGCENSDHVIVTNNPVQPTDFEYSLENPTCFGFEDGSINIDQIIGGTPPYVFSFNGAPFSSNASFSNLVAGEYPITLQDAMGCELSVNLLLEDGNDLAVDLGEDQYINLGETTDITAQSNVHANAIVNLDWAGVDSLECPSICFDIDVMPFITTIYTATITDNNGCTTEDNVTVFVNRPYDVFIPNAFSPNNDGHNDRITVFAGEDVVRIKTLNIFNRWGEMVYEVYNFPPNDLTFGWDGKYRSREKNSAVFVYMVEVEFIDGEIKLFKGDITLLR